MPTLPAVPGLASTDPAALRALVAMCERNGWNADAVAAAISEESGWNPAAHNPGGSDASGLVQIIPITAKALGTTTAQIRAMSAADQIPLVERYYMKASRGLAIGPWDFLALGLGLGNAPRVAPADIPDGAILYAAASPGARGNPGLQESDGSITMGSARRALRAFAARYPDRVDVPAERSAGASAAGLGALLLALGFGWILLRRLRGGRG